MKSSIIACVASFAALSAAQSLGTFPVCAQNCVGSSFTSLGCGQTDIKCICSSKDWIASLSCCISQNCSKTDQDTTIGTAAKICLLADITLPTTASCAATATGASGASAATGTATGSPTTSAPSRTATAAGATTGTASTGTAGSSVTSSAASAASATHTGGAANLVGQGFGAAGAALAALAML